MATLPKDCVNYEINLQMCPCKSETCDNRGICCECIIAHVSKGSKSACMRGAERDPSTLDLMKQAKTTCSTNQARNKEFCVCTWEPCDNKGVCCNCVRNHFKTDGSDCTACTR